MRGGPHDRPLTLRKVSVIMQRIAIVDPNDGTRDELRTVLLGLETVWLEAECSRYEFFFDVIQQSVPEVVIISLDSDQSKALNLIGQLAQTVPNSEDVTFVVAMIEFLYGAAVPLENRWSVIGTGVIFGDYDERLSARML